MRHYQIPGSNCDQDCHLALSAIMETEYVWHKQDSVAAYDLIVLPGGFSYGDYLRCGAIARFSPVMQSVVEEAGKGKLIIGICNGFQILCEARLAARRVNPKSFTPLHLRRDNVFALRRSIHHSQTPV